MRTHIQNERLEKVRVIDDYYDQLKLVYQWVKTRVISVNEFIDILEDLTTHD